VFDDDIEYCFHGPTVIPKNKTPATICTVNTIGTICIRQLFHSLLVSGALVGNVGNITCRLTCLPFTPCHLVWDNSQHVTETVNGSQS
jgi:hypothetical protein